MAEKVTKMRLKVDLKCSRCYNKVRKLLCKIPQIRDQVYDDKNNTVTIIVICCSPDKIQQKLCYKADGAITSIEIVKDTKTSEKPKVVTFAEKSAPKPVSAPKPALADVKPKPALADVKLKPASVDTAGEALKLKPVLKPALKPVGYPSVAAYQVGMTNASCYVGVPGGPYYGGPPEYGYPIYGTPVYDSYDNYQREYSSQEHQQECAIM